MPREILIANAAGFCTGVKRAIQKAEELPRAAIFGSLIHNPQEVARLERENKRMVRAAAQIGDDPVVITAHGLDVTVLEELKRDHQVVDLTCPLVTQIYKAGWDLESRGRRIVIVGDPDHVEVKGIASRMKNPLIVNKPEDVEKVPEDASIGVICQSTLLMDKFGKMVELLKARCRSVEAVSTICKPTQRRQQSADELARSVEVMIVIGGRNSSNTHKLAETCEAHLPQATHHVETAQELDPAWFAGKKRVGITAGASTPDYLIRECVERIQSLPD